MKIPDSCCTISGTTKKPEQIGGKPTLRLELQTQLCFTAFLTTQPNFDLSSLSYAISVPVHEKNYDNFTCV